MNFCSKIGGKEQERRSDKTNELIKELSAVGMIDHKGMHVEVAEEQGMFDDWLHFGKG